MAQTQPKRALLGSVIVASPLAMLSGGLIGVGPDTAPWGILLLLALPVATGIVTGWFLHAVDAMILTAIFAASTFFLIAILFDSLDRLLYFLPMLFAGTVVGPILGLLTRRFVR